MLRCFELLLLAHLDPHDGKLHEAYRKSVLKRFAECRDLLRPYFRFENFADRTLYTINDLSEQDARLREKCCLGDGQLACLVQRRNEVEGVGHVLNGNGQLQARPLNIITNRSGGTGGVGDTGGVCQSPNPNGRRFAPTPWHEIYGNQVRYHLPQTLSAKIKTAFKKVNKFNKC